MESHRTFRSLFDIIHPSLSDPFSIYATVEFDFTLLFAKGFSKNDGEKLKTKRDDPNNYFNNTRNPMMVYIPSNCFAFVCVKQEGIE